MHVKCSKFTCLYKTLYYLGINTPVYTYSTICIYLESEKKYKVQIISKLEILTEKQRIHSFSFH